MDNGTSCILNPIIIIWLKEVSNQRKFYIRFSDKILERIPWYLAPFFSKAPVKNKGGNPQEFHTQLVPCARGFRPSNEQ